MFLPSQMAASHRGDHVATRCYTSSTALMDGHAPTNGPIKIQNCVQSHMHSHEYVFANITFLLLRPPKYLQYTLLEQSQHMCTLKLTPVIKQTELTELARPTALRAFCQ